MTGSSLSLETLQQLDQPGPRYTSYPTAMQFHDGVEERLYLERLTKVDGPISVYLHLPFCRSHCDFCACNAIGTPHAAVGARYLDYLKREITAVAEALPGRRALGQIHWGGGTPTFHSPIQIEGLIRHIRDHFTVTDGAEIAIEVDPRITTREHLDTLSREGFNRLSLGIQDFTPTVQTAIGREQTLEQTRELLHYAREIGFSEGINFDLVYGLPGQELDTFNTNFDRVLELLPDRLAIYSFAFVPWIRPNQRRLKPEDLPEPALKLELYLYALERLREAGYEAIGMDHFSLPDDELAIAAREGRLTRNFMGYTLKAAPTTIGFGVSSIGELTDGYFQNFRKLPAYYKAIDEGHLPIERGCLLDDDDQLRRHVIMQLMCNFQIDKGDVSNRFEIDFDDYFASSIARLGELEDMNFLRNTDEAIVLCGDGRLFVRNAAMAFDRYLEEAKEARTGFSRTV